MSALAVAIAIAGLLISVSIYLGLQEIADAISAWPNWDEDEPARRRKEHPHVH